MRIYREALETITGKRVSEALLYLTDHGQVIGLPPSI
jgi:hypothetical protein